VPGLLRVIPVADGGGHLLGAHAVQVQMNLAGCADRLPRL
jgi:hypothetical protein